MAKLHNDTTRPLFYAPQLVDMDFSIMPCCNKPYNETEAQEFIDRGEPQFAIFDTCMCNVSTASTTVISWGNVTWWD